MARSPSGQRLSEPDIVQNPAVGAYALWQFGLGYQSEATGAVNMPLVFLVLPVLLHKRTLAAVSSTQKGSGLALFAAKFARDNEDLLGIHTRALILRTLTLRSICFAVNAGLATIDYSAATLYANTLPTKVKKPQLPERLKEFSLGAEKLGCWFARMSVPQIATTLRVEF